MIRAYRYISSGLDRSCGIALVVLRVTVGWLFVLHGVATFQMGTNAFARYLLVPAHVPLPGVLSWVVPALEVGGGALVALGLLTRAVVAALAVEMVCTGFLVKLLVFHTGVVTTSGPAGAELDFLFLTASLVILTAGPGRFSLDHLLRLESATREQRRADELPTDPASAASTAGSSL